MKALVASGLILRWGVSNLATDDMAELKSARGQACMTDETLYKLTRRVPEFDLIPWLEMRAIPVMAYSPLEQRRLLGPGAGANRSRLAAPATPNSGLSQGARASARPDSYAALDLDLTAEAITLLNRSFPRPTKRPRWRCSEGARALQPRVSGRCRQVGHCRISSSDRRRSAHRRA